MAFHTAERICLLLAWALVLLGLRGTALAGPGQQNDAVTVTTERRAEISSLIEKVLKTGSVNVLVGLKLPDGFTPEGHMASDDAIERQRANIATARKTLLESLSGLGVKEYGHWENLPFVALTVGEAALRRLAGSPNVTRIQEDGLSKTQ